MRSFPDERRGRDDWAAVESSLTSDDDVFVRRRDRRQRPPRGRRRLVGFALVAALAFVMGMGTGYARGYFESGDVGGTVRVTIPEGATLTVIAEELEARGIVKHARAFIIQAQSDGYATKFKPGAYRFHENEPYARLVAALVAGAEPAVVKVTIPEGLTIKQTARLLDKQLKAVKRTAYTRLTQDDPLPLELEGYKAGTTLEGMLFPATYEVEPDVRAKAFIEKQMAAFGANMAQVDLARARKANLTSYDVVIIASMVEREAQVEAERPVVAAVIWNRLRAGMLLQIDATIQYALGESKPELTYDDLEIDSLYNTYKHAGLPPTPIANPGLASLRAAADPADVDYLYYVARNDGTGRHYFSSSYEQFLTDKAKANAQ